MDSGAGAFLRNFFRTLGKFLLEIFLPWEFGRNLLVEINFGWNFFQKFFYGFFSGNLFSGSFLHKPNFANKKKNLD